MTMKKKYYGLALLTCAAGGLAWQNSIALVGLTEADAQKIAAEFFESGRGSLPGPAYVLKAPMIAQWKAKGPEERAQAVREMALYAKKMISSPAFENTYNGWIKERFHAIDHGIKPRAASAAAMSSTALLQQAQDNGTVMIVQLLGDTPPAALKEMFDKDMAEWKPRPRKAALVARGNKIAPLFPSNPEEFKKQFILLRVIESGGPDTMEGLEAAKARVANGQGNEQAQTEQKNYDEHNLRAELKVRLLEFLTLARSVDFSAQTENRKNSRIFVNRSYEGKSDSWKMLYRLGQEPTKAMMAVAEQWLKEL